MDLYSKRGIQEETTPDVCIYAVNMHQQTIIVYSRDTEVMVLLTRHRDRLSALSKTSFDADWVQQRPEVQTSPFMML